MFRELIDPESGEGHCPRSDGKQQNGCTEEENMPTLEEMKAKAEKPAQDAMRLHPFYRGKVQVTSKCAIRDLGDFAIWYTPGVAAPCKAIFREPELVYDYTNKGNSIAVVSDGTRVLGLGRIGPEAGLPVMEGKALLFKYLGGVDAFPICLDTKDADEIIRTVKVISPVFGGINLEDIENPKCFYVLERLRAEASIPVWHDDQQGTAAVTLAGLINALKIVKKKIGDAKITMIGIGAANVCIVRMLIKAGADPKKIIVVDSKGILNRKRDDIKPANKEKLEFCQMTNEENRDGGIAEAMKGQDVVIALSKPGPDVVEKAWVSAMADNAIVFVCANPIPEMWPWEAKEAGARIVATGRSDFPNQVNNPFTDLEGIIPFQYPVQPRQACATEFQQGLECILAQFQVCQLLDELWNGPDVP